MSQVFYARCRPFKNGGVGLYRLLVNSNDNTVGLFDSISGGYTYYHDLNKVQIRRIIRLMQQQQEE